MAQSDKDVCYLYYSDHANHNILDTCLMKTKGLHTVFQTPKVQRQFPRYQRSQLILADPSHSLAYPAYLTPPRRYQSLVSRDAVLVDDLDPARNVNYYHPMHQNASKSTCIAGTWMWPVLIASGVLVAAMYLR